MEKHLKSLELDKVLELLAEHTSCEDARNMARELKPESDLNIARGLMNQTRDAHSLLARFGGPSFGGLKNVNNALFRADAGSTLSLSELLSVAQVLHVIRSICQWRDSNEGVQTVLDVYFNALVPNRFLEDSIKTAIISEEEIADNASPELATIRRKIKAQESKVRDQLAKFTHNTNYSKYLQDNIITMRNGRYVIPVKNEYRSEVPGLVHDTSSSGATIFVEPMPIVEANNQIKLLRNQEKDEIDRVLAELSANVGNFADSIKSSYECAVELNLIFAKAQLAYSMKASVPEINDSGIIELRRARHPLIDKSKVVPVDINLGKDFDTIVITGPNTGGKTVSIKTIGLMCLMAMCGLMLPVDDRSRVSVFDNVLADIGDEQSIEQSLSTFSSHMTKIVNIIKQADNKSLVLIDELGAGTDPVEGAALAVSILEQLRNQGAKIASTTHYAELKSYALQTPGVINGSCEFDVQSLKPTYRLLIGVPGRSNAFAISKRLGLSDDIIEYAQELVSTENIRFEDVVDRLEQSRLEMEKEHKEAQEIRRKADEELKKAQKLKDEIQVLREKELENAKKQASHITEQAKREAYQLLNDLDALKKQQAKEKDAAEMARRARAVIKKDMNAIDSATDPIISSYESDEDYVLPRPLRIGDTVIIADLGNEAVVEGLKDKKGLVSVAMGTMKTRVKEENLRLVEKQKKATARRTAPTGKLESKANMSANTSLDLRGMTVDEGIMELDRYIDHALRMGIGEFTVIHGKGTGVLRKAVREYLKKSRFVKSSRLGAFGEGEDGVSIVTLK
ncbi:MAG: endonuclease MutS2 [Ruminococcus sp.]|nr:endonuclease MutS2 [Candidatus Copronaster equi]